MRYPMPSPDCSIPPAPPTTFFIFGPGAADTLLARDGRPCRALAAERQR